VDFVDQFWRAYPRRVAKKAAVAALDRVRRSDEVDFPRLLDAVRQYARSVAGKDMQYVAHPATWLNQGRWDDEYPAPQESDVLWRQRKAIEEMRARQRADDEWASRKH
jgi:hypothetical protein